LINRGKLKYNAKKIRETELQNGEPKYA